MIIRWSKLSKLLHHNSISFWFLVISVFVLLGIYLVLTYYYRLSSSSSSTSSSLAGVENFADIVAPSGDDDVTEAATSTPKKRKVVASSYYILIDPTGGKNSAGSMVKGNGGDATVQSEFTVHISGAERVVPLRGIDLPRVVQNMMNLVATTPATTHVASSDGSQAGFFTVTGSLSTSAAQAIQIVPLNLTQPIHCDIEVTSANAFKPVMEDSYKIVFLKTGGSTPLVAPRTATKSAPHQSIFQYLLRRHMTMMTTGSATAAGTSSSSSASSASSASASTQAVAQAAAASTAEHFFFVNNTSSDPSLGYSDFFNSYSPSLLVSQLDDKGQAGLKDVVTSTLTSVSSQCPDLSVGQIALYVTGQISNYLMTAGRNGDSLTVADYKTILDRIRADSSICDSISKSLNTFNAFDSSSSAQSLSFNQQTSSPQPPASAAKSSSHSPSTAPPSLKGQHTTSAPFASPAQAGSPPSVSRSASSSRAARYIADSDIFTRYSGDMQVSNLTQEEMGQLKERIQMQISIYLNANRRCKENIRSKLYENKFYVSVMNYLTIRFKQVRGAAPDWENPDAMLLKDMELLISLLSVDAMPNCDALIDAYFTADVPQMSPWIYTDETGMYLNSAGLPGHGQPVFPHDFNNNFEFRPTPNPTWYNHQQPVGSNKDTGGGGWYGWSFLPKWMWSVPQPRPPVCIPSTPMDVDTVRALDAPGMPVGAMKWTYAMPSDAADVGFKYNPSYLGPGLFTS
jgi:hypothetical protein